jgi:Cu(I)/Ag(I) efflux system membrane protein CusA/SilA
MIARWIDWCARNRFLVFTGTLLLVLAGIWALRRIPLDALPDISDVEVIIHTPWMGEPPSIIEDQVTYPIVTTLLAAPHVKAVRAQTMFGDSYVFVVFEDGTDLYWARSRVLEYMQQIQGRLPEAVHPVIGPDATGAGWVYEYALVDHSHQRSLAALRSLQDWYLRYQLETVPGVAEVASIGGFVRQYQVNVDPEKLRAYGIPLSTVIEKVRASTNEVGGRLLEMGGAEYMIRGLGYVYIDLNTKDYGGFVTGANNLFRQKLTLPPGYTYKWSGEYEFELRAKERLRLILPVVFCVIFLLLYMVFHSVAEAAVLIFPTIYALTGGLILQKLLGYNFSVAVWVGYIALFGIAVETGVVMVVYLHEALDHRLANGVPLRHEDIETAVIEGAVQRLRPKLMTVSVVLASLIPILWETGVGSDVMKPIAAPIVGGMITSTIHVLILVPVFFALMKERALRRGTLQPTVTQSSP